MYRNYLAALAVATLFSAASSVPAAEPLFADVVVAKAKGVEIRRSQLDDAFIAFKANMVSRGGTLPEEQRTKTEAQLLERLIVTQLLVNRATPADKAKAREKTDKIVADAARNAGSEEAFARQLKVLGVSGTQFTNRVLEQAIAEDLLSREIKSKITIPAERLQEFYETNDAAFRQPETARAAHILLSTRNMNTRLELPDDQKKAKRDKAEKILARAKKGEDFTKLAEEVSEDPAVKENKGEYKFTRAKDDPRRAMMPEFEVAAFALKPGDISNLVSTEYGFHIIKLLEIIPARKTPLTEVSDKIREFLLTQETEKQLPAYFEKMKKEASVEILDQKLADALAQAQKEAAK